ARARDHPVVDLEHIERGGEIKQVDGQAEDQRGDEIAPAAAKRVRKFFHFGPIMLGYRPRSGHSALPNRRRNTLQPLRQKWVAVRDRVKPCLSPLQEKAGCVPAFSSPWLSEGARGEVRLLVHRREGVGEVLFPWLTEGAEEAAAADVIDVLHRCDHLGRAEL